MKNVAIFAFGAAVGSFVTWRLLSTRYYNMLEEEIEACEKYHRERLEPTISNEKCAYTEEEAKDALESLKEEYPNLVNGLGYTIDIEEDGEVYLSPPSKDDIIKPYVITPEEAGDEGYVIKTWSYYLDGAVTDEDDMVVVNYDLIVGDAIEKFNQYEEHGAVYVRNDNTECDYEILLINKKYSDTYEGVN